MMNQSERKVVFYEANAGKAEYFISKSSKILSHACVGGKKEGEGPIGKHLDLIVEDPMFGKENWEESESCFLKTAGEIVLRKGKKKKKDVRMAFCGDLLGQLIASSFGIAELEIPYYGVYGACSSIGLLLSIGAMAVNGGFADLVLSGCSSHFASAEKEFRFSSWLWKSASLQCDVDGNWSGSLFIK